MNSKGLNLTDPSEILEEQAKYYEILYTSTMPKKPQSSIFFNRDIPQLNIEDKGILDLPLNLTEISKALKEMPNDKSLL